jgi:hypothetical protein
MVILVNIVYERCLYRSYLLSFGVWNDVFFIWGGRNADVEFAVYHLLNIILKRFFNFEKNLNWFYTGIGIVSI